MAAMKKISLATVFLCILFLATFCFATPSLQFKITGLSSDLLANVNANLQIKQNEISVYSEQNISNFYQQTPQIIAKALEPYGYFKSKVTLLHLTHKKDKWEGEYRVVLGAPIKITTIDLQIIGAGAVDANFNHKLRDFPLHQGEIFQADKYNGAKQFLFDLAANNGYVTALLVQKEVQIDLEQYSVKIILHFDTGPQYYFGATTFNSCYFSQRFLHKYLPYKEGEIYSSSKITELQEVLTNSNFFQAITVNPQITNNVGRQVPVEVVLVPRQKKQYTFGVGYGTDTGARGSLGLELRYLTPEGQHLKSLLQVSQVQSSLELHYLIPGAHPARDLYDFSAAGESLYLINGKSFAGQLGAGYITVLKGWTQTIKLALKHEHYQLQNQPYQSSTLLIPSINWLHSQSDDPIRPTRGHTISVNIQGASKYLIAKNSFFQAQGDFKYLNTIFWQFQVLLHGIIGYTSVGDLNNLPLSLQFYTGGAQSIRGFGYNSIGPGRNIAVGSFELRHRIVGDFYLAGLFDIGNVNDDLLARPKRSIGAGIVWRTGIGALELTYAKAISEPGTGGRIQFSMGPEL